MVTCEPSLLFYDTLLYQNLNELDDFEAPLSL